MSHASVDLASETAVVWPAAEAKITPNWREELGEALAKHLTTCGFSSKVQGQHHKFVSHNSQLHLIYYVMFFFLSRFTLPVLRVLNFNLPAWKAAYQFIFQVCLLAKTHHPISTSMIFHA